jgi:ribosomal protein S18 acetylase RimI-like enzyme
MVAIRPAAFPDDRDAVRSLFAEYAASLDVDLCFQGFAAELAGLPGAYAAPTGRLLLAEHDAEVVGCVAMRPLTGSDCEMKRLYVRPTVRGMALGRRLVERICDEARAAGYRRIRLDTLASMTAAIALYESIGFESTAPYGDHRLDGMRYFARRL